MNRNSRWARLTAASLLVLWSVANSSAQVTLTSGLNLNRSANLLTNGSFENHPTNGSTPYYWGTGTTLTSFPFQVPQGWNSVGGPLNYAGWADTGFYWSSAPVPDGKAALYFGNQFASSISETPTFNQNGLVSFINTPVIVPGNGYAPAVKLSQTISVNQGSLYGLSFWTSGETAARWPNTPLQHDGIFGLDVSGVGDLYLAAPCGGSNLGASHVYECLFVPTSNTVTISFTNWGHMGRNIVQTQGWTLPDSTELVLDDVIVNQIVPEPGTISVLAVGSLLAACKRAKDKRSQLALPH